MMGGYVYNGGRKPERRDLVQTHYKVTGPDGEAVHGGDFVYDLPKNGKPGAWTPAIEDCQICMVGYHTTPAPDTWAIPGMRVWQVERRGVVEVGRFDAKAVNKSIRLVRERPDLVPAWADEMWEYLKPFKDVTLRTELGESDIPLKVFRENLPELVNGARRILNAREYVMYADPTEYVPSAIDPVGRKIARAFFWGFRDDLELPSPDGSIFGSRWVDSWDMGGYIAAYAVARYKTNHGDGNQYTQQMIDVGEAVLDGYAPVGIGEMDVIQIAHPDVVKDVKGV